MEEAEKIVELLRSKGFEAEVCDTPVPLFDCGVVAGMPELPGDFSGEYIMVPKEFCAEACYEIVVRGDSMIEGGIEPGDRLTVKVQSYCKDGDIIIALLNGETTVKIFMKDKNNEPWLIPMNENYLPIKIRENDDFYVIGLVVYVQKPAQLSQKMCRKMYERIASKTSDKITVENITSAIIKVKDMIQSNRQWYAVFRVLIDRGYYNSINDVNSFVNDMTELYAVSDIRLDAEDLRRVAVLSFSKPVACWEEDDAPVRGKRFYDYLAVAKMFNKAL